MIFIGIVDCFIYSILAVADSGILARMSACPMARGFPDKVGLLYQMNKETETKTDNCFSNKKELEKKENRRRKQAVHETERGRVRSGRMWNVKGCIN